MAEAVSGNRDNYSKLYDYRFEDSRKFIEGWRKLVDIVPENQLLDSFVKAQVFFYSREVEPVDLDGYRVWLQENEKTIEVPDVKGLLESSDSTNQVQDTQPDTQPDTAQDSVELSAGRHPINFAELIAMVHNGIPLPDTEDLNIEPTNEQLSPAVMQRPKKPWEIQVE